MIRTTGLSYRVCALPVPSRHCQLRGSGIRGPPPAAQRSGGGGGGGDDDDSGKAVDDRSGNDAAPAAVRAGGVPWTVGLYVSKRRDHRTNSLGEILEDDEDSDRGESEVMEPPKEIWNAER